MTILNSVDIVNTISWSNTIWAIIGAICFIFVGFVIAYNDMDFRFVYFGVFLFIITFLIAAQPQGYQYTKIEATIDETVSAIELLDKYEVLNHRGEIYELKYIDPEKVGEKDEVH